MKINLHENPRPLRVGDMALFESKTVDHNEQDNLARWILTQEWFKPIAKAHRIDHLIRSNVELSERCALAELCWVVLQSEHDQIRKQGNYPDWMRFLPLEASRRLEHLWVTGEGPDQYRIVPKVTYTGIGYVVFEGGLVEQTDEFFGLGRLNFVAQLGFLHDPTMTENGWRECPLPFPQTRYFHLLNTNAIATLIGTQVDLSEEKLRVLRVAAQSHDALTPAGGDSIKGVDRAAFDEDMHYPELFERRGWKEFRDAFELSEAELAKTILGEGLLGSILDASDKMAYVACDLSEFLMKNEFGRAAWQNFTGLYNRITRILAANPYPCSVWEYAAVADGELFFTDANRLADFLRIRALMFSILYNNASARFYEAGFTEEVVRDLYRRNVLTRELLLKMTDRLLVDVIGQELGVTNYRHEVSLDGSETPRVLRFKTKQEATAMERQLAVKEPHTMTHYEHVAPPSTKCLQTFKVLHEGKPKPFRLACPELAWDVEQISCDSHPHRVFAYDLGALCKNAELANRLLQGRNARIAK